MRNIEVASGVPKDKGRFVTRMKTGPRDLRACSLAASDAEVDEAGYSPCNDGQQLEGQINGEELTPYTKPNDPSSDGHHPEHTGRYISLVITEKEV
jgi:hypothetical protein